MKRSPVISSNLVSVGYDDDSQVLEIEFWHSVIYQYFEVPSEVYHQLMGAQSKGRYHAYAIKWAYRFQSVNSVSMP